MLKNNALEYDGITSGCKEMRNKLHASSLSLSQIWTDAKRCQSARLLFLRSENLAESIALSAVLDHIGMPSLWVSVCIGGETSLEIGNIYLLLLMWDKGIRARICDPLGRSKEAQWKVYIVFFGTYETKLRINIFIVSLFSAFNFFYLYKKKSN